MRHRSLKKIRGGLKVGIENGNKLIVFDIAAIHGWLEITSFVSLSNDSVPVDDIGTLLLPFTNLFFDQQLSHWVIRIIKNLY